MQRGKRCHAGDDNLMSAEIKTMIMFVIGSNNKKHTRCRVRSSFMWCRGGKVWVVETPENEQMVIRWHLIVKDFIWWDIV